MKDCSATAEKKRIVGKQSPQPFRTCWPFLRWCCCVAVAGIEMGQRERQRETERDRERQRETERDRERGRPGSHLATAAHHVEDVIPPAVVLRSLAPPIQHELLRNTGGEGAREGVWVLWCVCVVSVRVA